MSTELYKNDEVSTFGKHVIAFMILGFVFTVLVCAGAIGYWAITHLGQAGLVLLAIAGIGLVVHVMVRLIDWDV